MIALRDLLFSFTRRIITSSLVDYTLSHSAEALFTTTIMSKHAGIEIVQHVRTIWAYHFVVCPLAAQGISNLTRIGK